MRRTRRVTIHLPHLEAWYDGDARVLSSFFHRKMKWWRR